MIMSVYAHRLTEFVGKGFSHADLTLFTDLYHINNKSHCEPKSLPASAVKEYHLITWTDVDVILYIYAASQVLTFFSFSFSRRRGPSFVHIVRKSIA